MSAFIKNLHTLTVFVGFFAISSLFLSLILIITGNVSALSAGMFFGGIIFLGISVAGYGHIQHKINNTIYSTN